MRMQWTLLAALVFALLITLFALANMDPVPVHYWFGYAADLPLIVVILLSALLGGLGIGSIGMIRQYRLQRQIRRLERQLADFRDPQDDISELEPQDSLTGNDDPGTEPEPQTAPKHQDQ